MRFLADQDVYGITIGFLKGLGHDVVTAAECGLAQATDTELLRMARDQGRVVVTRDRDFGALVFLHGDGPGVIYLRMLSSTGNTVHQEFERVLSLYSEETLRGLFVVIEPAGIAHASAEPRVDRKRGRSGAGITCLDR